MSSSTCYANEPMDEQTEYLVDSIKKTLALVTDTMNIYTGWMKITTPYSADALRHNLEHIYITCHDVLHRAIYLLTTTSTNYESASAINLEVANIIGMGPTMTKYRSCDVKFCSCKVRELYRLMRTPDELSLQQMEIENQAHAAQDAHVKAVKELEKKKKALSDAKYALHSFHWDIYASNEDEMERITALVAASTTAKREQDDCENLVFVTKGAFDLLQMKLYDIFRISGA
jgi:hypothetical protein